jgi:HEAT repeat protein
LEALEAQSDHVSLPPEVCRGLLLCLGHSRKSVQRRAAAQLVRFSRTRPEIVVALTKKLADPDPRVRWTAAFALSHLDLPEPSPLPVLIENLGYDESDLRWAAATAILRLAAHHLYVIEEVQRLAGAGNAVQRRMALYCLRDLAQTGLDTQAVYLASLNDPNPGVRLAGLSCLGKLKLASPEARRILLQLLDADPDPGVRRAAVVTLGQLGDPAPAVIEALTRAARSDDVGLSKAATGALEKLQEQ